MKSNRIQITIDLSEECYNAIIFLKSKRINGRNFLRLGGEKMVIEMAQKYKFKLVKYKLPF